MLFVIFVVVFTVLSWKKKTKYKKVVQPGQASVVLNPCESPECENLIDIIFDSEGPYSWWLEYWASYRKVVSLFPRT